MTKPRKTPAPKPVAKKPASGITKAKVKRVARKAQVALETAARDAGLALRRTARTLKTKVEEAKGPTKRAMRRMERKVASALGSAGESIAEAGHSTKVRFDAARKAFAGAAPAKKPAGRKGATGKPAAKKPSAKRAGARKKPAA